MSLKALKIISERKMQDMQSVYVDIREEVLSRTQKESGKKFKVDFSDIKFQIKLLKTDKINPNYILVLILEKSKAQEDTKILKSDIHRLVRSNLGNRTKEKLIMDFVNETDLAKFQQKEEIFSIFYEYDKNEKRT